MAYRGPYNNYLVQKQSDGSIRVMSQSTAEGPDTLTNVQILQFSDQSIDSTSIGQVPAPVITAVVNAADFKSEALSAGAWISILGQNLGQAETAASVNTVTLGWASVSVCGMPAVLQFRSDQHKRIDELADQCATSRWGCGAGILPYGSDSGWAGVPTG